MPALILQNPRSPVQFNPPAPPSAADVARAKRDAIHELRGIAAAVASDSGHALGTWHESAAEEEVAYCRTCRQAVYIQLVRPPHFEGPAITARCPRPDAFLANAHDSEVR